ncbi:MAG: flagellar biosynthetic protein FliR [Phycisphaerae bacterium]|nr:flagellar biosynthetic protein FliR [Phycisphaerae bacterium]
MATSIDTIQEHLGAVLVVVFRLSGLALFGPVIGSPTIPMRIKALLVFLLGVAAYPTIAAGPLSGASVPLTFGSLAPMIVMEVLIGAIVGFLALMPLIAMQMGGLITSQQMGLGFARIYNPAMDDEGDSIEQAFFFLAISTFLALGGLEQIISAVVRSFQFLEPGGGGRILAVGGYGLENALVSTLAGVFLSAMELALRVSAPLMAIFFLETVAMGFLSKSMPALNLMALGFPLRILLGFTVIVIGMAVMTEALEAFTLHDLDLIGRVLVLEPPGGGAV